MRPTILIPILGALAMLPATSALAGGCCGGAVAPAPVLWAQPAPAPTIYAWPSYGGSSCGGCGSYGYRGYGYGGGHSAWAKQPIYVVNQGPYYSGAGIMVPSLTWSKGAYTGGYPYVGGDAGWYDGGPYADPMGRRYVRRYGYNEQYPAGYSDAPVGPRIITRAGYAPRYAPAYRSRVRRPYHHPVVVRANAEVRQMGNRLDVRLYRTGPAKKGSHNHGY